MAPAEGEQGGVVGKIIESTFHSPATSQWVGRGHQRVAHAAAPGRAGPVTRTTPRPPRCKWTAIGAASAAVAERTRTPVALHLAEQVSRTVPHLIERIATLERDIEETQKLIGQPFPLQDQSEVAKSRLAEFEKLMLDHSQVEPADANDPRGKLGETTRGFTNLSTGLSGTESRRVCRRLQLLRE